MIYSRKIIAIPMSISPPVYTPPVHAVSQKLSPVLKLYNLKKLLPIFIIFGTLHAFKYMHNFFYLTVIVILHYPGTLTTEYARCVSSCAKLPLSEVV